MLPASLPARQEAAEEHDPDQLFALAYDELRRVARRHLRRERSNHTLTPTALVHEAFLKIAPQQRATFEDRRHFTCVAAQAMRRILVNYARDRGRQKRGGELERITLKPYHGSREDVDLLDLDEALDELDAFDPLKRRLVELRYFGGLAADDVADALGFSRATFYREWAAARAWLFSRLNDPA